MKIVLLTPEETHPNEEIIVRQLFSQGLSLLHVRKPKYSCNEMRTYLQKFNADEHLKMSIHSFPELLDEFDLGGFHKTTQNKYLNLPESNVRMSASFHAIDEVLLADKLDYCFLSPIFESTSKTGYGPHFTDTELEFVLKQATVPVYALGGVTKERMPQLKKLSFSGVAVLGAVWMDADPIHAFSSLREAVQ